MRRTGPDTALFENGKNGAIIARYPRFATRQRIAFAEKNGPQPRDGDEWTVTNVREQTTRIREDGTRNTVYILTLGERLSTREEREAYDAKLREEEEQERREEEEREARERAYQAQRRERQARNDQFVDALAQELLPLGYILSFPEGTEYDVTKVDIKYEEGECLHVYYKKEYSCFQDVATMQEWSVEAILEKMQPYVSLCKAVMEKVRLFDEKAYSFAYCGERTIGFKFFGFYIDVPLASPEEMVCDLLRRKDARVGEKRIKDNSEERLQALVSEFKRILKMHGIKNASVEVWNRTNKAKSDKIIRIGRKDVLCEIASIDPSDLDVASCEQYALQHLDKWREEASGDIAFEEEDTVFGGHYPDKD